MIFFTDLDNTIIYSHKHDIGPNKLDVELYQGRNISFITEKTHNLLLTVRERMLVVPVSTRTVEQYERIDLRVGSFKYALVCNGGLLLKDGKRVDSWYADSLELIKESEYALSKALRLLDSDSRRTFELRFIENLFVFTKCDEPEVVVSDLKKQLEGEPVDVFNNGTKVYVVPFNLSKGKAVERFVRWIEADTVKTIAAGDSEFDIPMLKKVDVALAPYGFCEKFGVDCKVIEMSGEEIFSDALLSRCLEE